MDNNKYPLPYEIGYYQPSKNFLAIQEHIAVTDRDGGVIALCGPDDPESKEFARLFSAAPDMLEALEKCALYVGMRTSPQGIINREAMDLYVVIHDALAKAKGA